MIRLLTSFLAIALVAAAGTVSAQDKKIPGQSPPAEQSAPSQSSHAPGHDAQSGKPATGETQETAGQGADKRKIEDDNKAITETSPSK